MLFGAPRPPAGPARSVTGAALLFLAGVAAGLAIPWPPTSTTIGRGTPIVDPATQAEPVRGTSSADASDLSLDPVISRAPPRSDVGVPAPGMSRARPPSAIADSATHFTVLITGGDIYGAGVALDDGYVLTCQHVVEGLPEIVVSFADGGSFAASVLDSDPALDLALLKIDAQHQSSSRPVSASIATVKPGDELFAMGAPRKMAFSLARGMASFVGRRFGDAYYLQTDLPFNGGSSGGPVMNEAGEMVAIASFILKRSEGLSFALPIDYAYRRFDRWLGASGKRSALPSREAFERWLSDLAQPPGGAE